MAKCFLLTRPNYDTATSYLHYFAKDAIMIAKKFKGIHVADLEWKKATRPNLEKNMSCENPGLVFLNGHGDRMSVFGHKDEIILDSKKFQTFRKSFILALSYIFQ